MPLYKNSLIYAVRVLSVCALSTQIPLYIDILCAYCVYVLRLYTRVTCILFAYSIQTLHIDSMHTDSMIYLFAYPISRIYMYALYKNLYALRTPSTGTMQNMYSMQTIHRPCKR